LVEHKLLKKADVVRRPFFYFPVLVVGGSHGFFDVKALLGQRFICLPVLLLCYRMIAR